MGIINFIRLTVFWLTITFIISTIFAFTIGQILPVEFRNNKMQSDYYYFAYTVLPFSFLLTMVGTIKKKNKKAKNWTIVGLTILSSIICFFILVRIMFSIGFGAWINEAVLYRKKEDKTISINRQIFDDGAFGYGGYRNAELKPFLKYFLIVKQIDTAKIDKTKWDFVNEEGDIHFP